MATDFTNLLAFSKAKSGGQQLEGLTSDSTLSLVWDGISSSQMEDAAAWEKSNRESVVDPTIENKVYEGTWRSVSVITRYKGVTDRSTERDTDSKYDALTHVFAKDYHTTLLTGGVLDWTKARLVSERTLTAGVNVGQEDHPGFNDDSRMLNVAFPNCSPYSALAILNEVFSLGVVAFDPVIKGETYGTGYRRISVSNTIEEDGSCTISMVLADISEFSLEAVNFTGSPNENTTTWLFDVPRELAQPILDGNNGAGQSASVSYQDGTALCDIVLRSKNTSGVSAQAVSGKACSYISTSDYLWGTANDALLPIPGSLNANESYRRSIRSNGDGTYDITRTVRVTQERLAAVDGETVMNNEEHTVLQWQDLGMEPGTALRDIGTAEDGKVKRQSISVAEDCSRNVTTTEDTVVKISITDTWVSDNDTHSLTTVRNDTFANLQTAIAALDSAKINNVTFNYNQYNLVDYSIRTSPGSGGGSLPTKWGLTEDISETSIEKKYDKFGGQGYQWRTVTRIYDINHYTSPDDAWTAIKGGLQGSNVSHVHKYVWRAKKYKSMSVGSWETKDPVLP